MLLDISEDLTNLFFVKEISHSFAVGQKYH